MAQAAGARQRLAGGGDGLIEAVDQAHVVLARQPPRHAHAQQRRRRVAHDERALHAAIGRLHRRRQVRRQALVLARHRRAFGQLRDQALVLVEPGQADPRAAQPFDAFGLLRQPIRGGGRPPQACGQRLQRRLLGTDAR